MNKNVKIDGARHALALRAERDQFTLAESETIVRGRRRWDGARLEVALEDGARPLEALVVRGAGGRLEVWIDSERHVVEEERRGATAGGAGASDDDLLTAPMPAKVVKLACAPGDAVEEGQTLVVLESMKMELALHAPRAGRVRRVGTDVIVGAIVPAGTALVELEPADADGAVKASGGALSA
jgi:3-methylcrotonyl-CoA carboxylase alpha subunit